MTIGRRLARALANKWVGNDERIMAPHIRGWLPVGVLAVAMSAVPWPPASAGEGAITFNETAAFDDCHDQANFVSVPVERAQEMVPEGYTVAATGEPETSLRGADTQLEVSELRCENVTLDGTVLPGPVSMAFAVLPLTGPPDGSEEPPDEDPVADVYLLFFSTNSKPLASWLRAGTDLEAFHVPGIVYDYAIPEAIPGQPSGVNTFSFEAPTPPQWAFTVEGVAAVQQLDQLDPAEIPASRAWQDTKTPDGKTWRVKLTSAKHDNFLAPAEVTLQAAPGSEMEQIMVTNPAVPSLAVSGLIPDWKVQKTRTMVERCSQDEREAALRAEQADVEAVLGEEFMTLNGPAELAALAARDPVTGRGAYDFLDHQFASARGMGVAIIDTASLATGVTPGRPNLLLYAPSPDAANVVDPFGADFPYRLVGWGYTPSSSYNWEQHPTELDGRCITRADWFVHERGIHPADTWQNIAVPPPNDDPHGTATGDEPITPNECGAEPCPAGFQHPRIWDIHLWRDGAGADLPSVSISHPSATIPGWDPGVGVSFFYPPPLSSG